MELNKMIKPYNMKEEFIPFEPPSLFSKGYNNNLQDFHQYANESSSSSNLMLVAQSSCLYEPCHNDNNNNYNYNHNYNPNVNFYECKPLITSENLGGGQGQVLDNFQGGPFGGGYLNFPNPRLNPICHNMIGASSHDIKPVSFVVPDEVSSVNSSPNNGYYKRVGMMNNKGGGTSRMLAGSTFKGWKRTNVIKGQWAVDEDRVLTQLVEQYGVRKWSHIAQMLPGRIGKQCRERWHNHLRPDIKKDIWSEEEDKILIQSHTEIGNKWAEIAKRLPGRTENSIKNHWNATKRRQYSKRKCRSRYPRGSLLQDYIKSLNLDAAPKTSRQRKTVNKNRDSSLSTDHDNAVAASSKAQAQTNVGFSGENYDMLVPNYELISEEEASFCFDDNMFQEGCSIDSLLDGISCATDFGDNGNAFGDVIGSSAQDEPVLVDDEKNDEMQVKNVGSKVMGSDEDDDDDDEVKQELDLVEMMTQVINGANEA